MTYKAGIRGLWAPCAPQGWHLRRYFTLSDRSICGRCSIFVGQNNPRSRGGGDFQVAKQQHPPSWEVPAPLVQTSLSLGKGYLGTTEDNLQLLFHMCHGLQEALLLDGMGSHFSIRPWWFLSLNYVRTSGRLDSGSSEVALEDLCAARRRCDIKPPSFFTFKFHGQVIKKQLPLIWVGEEDKRWPHFQASGFFYFPVCLISGVPAVLGLVKGMGELPNPPLGGPMFWKRHKALVRNDPEPLRLAWSLTCGIFRGPMSGGPFYKTNKETKEHGVRQDCEWLKSTLVGKHSCNFIPWSTLC